MTEQSQIKGIVKLTVWKKICNACKDKRIDFIVLHGIDGNQIGRDVDVWLDKSKIPLTYEAMRETAEELGLTVFHINSAFGHRYLFFDGNEAECGLFEFHCVRDLRWFWVGNPNIPELAATWKRIVLPLLSKDCSKAQAELKKRPLSDKEREFLSIYLEKTLHLSQSESLEFFTALSRNDTVSASKKLRVSLFYRTWRHPAAAMQFVCRRLVSPFWLLAKPCGPVIVTDSIKTAESIRSIAFPQKGVLTEIGILDFSKVPLFFLPFRLVAVRTFLQGRQRATILVLPRKFHFTARILLSPVIWSGNENPTSVLATAMKRILRWQER